MRPTLKPALRRLRRGEDEEQLGVAPGRRLVLRGLAPPDRELLDRLDGTRTEEQLAATDPRATALLALLRSAAALDDAAADPGPLSGLSRSERQRLTPDLAQWSLCLADPSAPREVLRARQAAVVHVHGAGRLGSAVAALLAAAGVGRVAVVDERRAGPGDAVPGGLSVGDVGAPSAVAATAAVRRAAPSTDTAPPRLGEVPQLAVLCGPVRPELLGGLARAGVAHLATRVEDDRAVVGPLVLPGTSPCCGCVDLERRDRDAAWPRVASALAAADPAPHPGTGDGGDVVLVTGAAAVTATQALAWVDADVSVDGAALGRRRDRGSETGPLASPLGPPAAVGATLELALPGWQWRRRPWPAHPACGCGAASGAPTAAGPARQAGPSAGPGARAVAQ